MKQAYTQYSSRLRALCKEEGNIDPNIFLHKAWQHMKERREWKAHALLQTLAIVDLDLLENGAIDIFLPGRGFLDWLVECVKEIEPQHVVCVQHLIGQGHVCVLHFPTSSKLNSLAFSCPDHKLEPFSQDEVKEEIPWGEMQPNGCLWGLFSLHDHKHWGLNHKLSNEGISAFTDPSGELIWHVKLIVGLGMYISAFPETVKDGPPDNLKHPSHHQYPDAKTIGISERISLGGTHASPIAHFRKGHFRLLQSEKFTKKRFQAVFVHETFVNAAKAKTVLAPEEVTD